MTLVYTLESVMRYLLSLLLFLSTGVYAQVNTCVERGVKVFRTGLCEGGKPVAVTSRQPTFEAQSAPQGTPGGWNGPGKDPQLWRNGTA